MWQNILSKMYTVLNQCLDSSSQLSGEKCDQWSKAPRQMQKNIIMSHRSEDNKKATSTSGLKAEVGRKVTLWWKVSTKETSPRDANECMNSISCVARRQSQSETLLTWKWDLKYALWSQKVLCGTETSVCSTRELGDHGTLKLVCLVVKWPDFLGWS